MGLSSHGSAFQSLCDGTCQGPRYGWQGFAPDSQVQDLQRSASDQRKKLKIDLSLARVEREGPSATGPPGTLVSSCPHSAPLR